MKRASVFAVVPVAAAIALAATDLAAQARPDFSGSWTMVAPAAPAAAPAAPAGGGGGGGGGRGGGRGGGGGLGMTATLAQTAGQLTVTRQQGGAEVRLVYNLDGSESRNTVQGRGGAMEQVSRARFDAGKLIITTTVNAGAAPVETTMALSLNAQGQLVVENTGVGRGGGAPTTTTLTYTKGN
jgi:hypothetical protein